MVVRYRRSVYAWVILAIVVELLVFTEPVTATGVGFVGATTEVPLDETEIPGTALIQPKSGSFRKFLDTPPKGLLPDFVIYF